MPPESESRPPTGRSAAPAEAEALGGTGELGGELGEGEGDELGEGEGEDEGPIEDEGADPARMRRCAALPFLCATCLLLVDGGYAARFWTQLEAWLSLKAVSPSGLVDAPSRERCRIALLGDEPDFMASLVLEQWVNKDASQACAVLASPSVAVGREAQRDEQLAAIARLDAWLRAKAGASMPALARAAEQRGLHSSSSRSPQMV